MHEDLSMNPKALTYSHEQIQDIIKKISQNDITKMMHTWTLVFADTDNLWWSILFFLLLQKKIFSMLIMFGLVPLMYLNSMLSLSVKWAMDAYVLVFEFRIEI